MALSLKTQINFVSWLNPVAGSSCRPGRELITVKWKKIYSSRNPDFLQGGPDVSPILAIMGIGYSLYFVFTNPSGGFTGYENNAVAQPGELILWDLVEK